MKVKLLRSVGTAYSTISAGRVMDLDDKLAARWIEKGICEPAEAEAENPAPVVFTDIVEKANKAKANKALKAKSNK